ncbi:MAG: metal-dependent hydrolase [Patescibacteria group bacterium]|nr:metal-dependent hydrolase [Patescibacteria group bacterium]MDD4610442.1 metal-dependent hydrolase [Patescibacteria group bacterium]
MFLDFAFGIITSILTSYYCQTALTPLLYYCVLFSILPDLDFIIYKIFKIKQDKGYKHRDLFHYPLLYLPLGGLLLILFNKILFWPFLIISFFHFMHDSIMYGRGVKWLFPFSENSYAFIYEYSRVKKWGLWQWVFVFNEKNLEQWDEEHGDEDWIQNIYYAHHPIAIIEFGAFTVSLILLFWYLA